jgi:tRNA 5-methylaminomethyl-2-thiouridine biosynthesis bifunctional protein
MTLIAPTITPATLHFEDATPVSTQFGDVYFCKASGVEESTYVFLQGNQLEARFAKAVSGFTVAETGFGTGLNFLLCARLWRECAPPEAVLHYISIEKHPIAPDMLMGIYAQHPLRDDATDMLATYPPLMRGVHTRTLWGGRVHLTLLFDDVRGAMREITPYSVDAWFLDGFSPAKNPDMWEESVMLSVANRTKAGGTFATFTAAGHVKRALIAGGFEVKKCKGYGFKREMLVGNILF